MRKSTVFILCILVASTIAKIPKVNSWEEENVHTHLTAQSLNLLPLGSSMHSEFDAHLDDLLFGAKNEDINDVIYGHTTPGIMLLTHFWDADEGIDDSVEFISDYNNAYEKALALYERALQRYEEGDYLHAYRLIGRVAHLIQDQCVPAHVHEDIHPGIPEWVPGVEFLGGGDDSLEDWFFESFEFLLWTSESVTEGLIEFPEEIKTQLHQGHWQSGLYYLMYTTNQLADYFASDDEDGDTDDDEGWMDYSIIESGAPTKDWHLSDNDRNWIPLTLSFEDNDNDNDGDLSTIVGYTIPYGIRAVATLFKLFYECVHPPEASVQIDFVDEDIDGNADYRWVKLDLTYNVGAHEYENDLEERFSNGNGEWTEWHTVPKGTEGGRRITWVLEEGDGPKEIQYQVRNLMGLLASDSDEIDLVEISVPCLFNYKFLVGGLDSRTASVNAWIDMLWVGTEKGDGEVEFYFKAALDDGYGSYLAYWHREPAGHLYYKIGPYTDWGHGGGSGYIDLTRLTHDMIGVEWGEGWIGEPSEPFDWSFVDDFTIDFLEEGQTVRLLTEAYDYDPDFPLVNDDDPMDTVYTGVYTIPTDHGYHNIDGPRWWNQRSDGEVNNEYCIHGTISAHVIVDEYFQIEEPPEERLPASIRYGVEREHVATSELTAGILETTEWTARIDNPAVEYEMDGRELYAWTEASAPDGGIGGFSSVHILITDPLGRKVGKTEEFAGFYIWDPVSFSLNPVYDVVSYNQIPGVSIANIPFGDNDDNGTFYIFDQREIGYYKVDVISKRDAEETDTYSIGIISNYRRSAPFQPIGPQPQQQIELLIQDKQVPRIPTDTWGGPQKDSYIIQSLDSRVSLPPIADAGEPYVSYEGSTITFDAGKSVDKDSDTLTYRWDFNNDEIWDTDWLDNPVTHNIWDDDWTGFVTVQVNDGILNDSSTVPISVMNVAPTVKIEYEPEVVIGQEISFSGVITDPGVEDTFTVYWDFGDGTFEADNLNPIHEFSERGKYLVNLTVFDDDGGRGSHYVEINVGVDVSVDPVISWVPAPPYWFFPKESTRYKISIQNKGNINDKFDILIDGLPTNWYSLSKRDVSLNPQQSKDVNLKVSIPYNTDPKIYEFIVIAISQSEPDIMDYSDTEVHVLEASEHPDYMYWLIFLLILIIILYIWNRYFR